MAAFASGEFSAWSNHSRLFEAETDDSFAARFHDSRADKQRLVAKLGIAHTFSVGLEIGNGLLNRFLSRSIAGAKSVQSLQDCREVAFIELFSARPAAQSFALVLAGP